MSRRSLSLVRAALVDALLANLAFALAYYVRYDLELFLPVLDANRAPYQNYLTFQIGYSALLLALLALNGAYAARRGGSWLADLPRIINAAAASGVILIAATFITLPLVYSRLLILQAVVISVALLGLARLIERALQAEWRRRGLGVSRLLIVGAGDVGRAVMRNIVAHPEIGYQIVGFVDDDAAKTSVGRYKLLGSLEQVESIVTSERVDEVIIALPWMYQRKIIGLVRACEARGARARVVPDLFQLSLNRLDVDDIGGLPLLGVKEPSIPRVGRLAKRALDVILAAAGLIVAAPLMALIALIIRLESRGPVLFTQLRVGEKGRLFYIHKFRSMRLGAEAEQDQLRRLNQADGPLFKIKDDPRLTRFGRLLRRVSLDELPQLFNVLLGEMSLVGPRPGLPDEVAQYQPWQRQRLEISPGITGLWQVSGRSDISFDEMCLLDIYYIENWSLSLDLIIMLRTIPRVLFGNGAY